MLRTHMVCVAACASSQLPIWFDSGYKYMRFTRNAIVNNQPGSNGAGFELSFGPALVDNNIFLGAGGGTGVTGMDASGVGCRLRSNPPCTEEQAPLLTHLLMHL